MAMEGYLSQAVVRQQFNYALCYVKMYNQQKSFVLEAYPIRKEMRKLYIFFLYKSFFILIIMFCFSFLNQMFLISSKLIVLRFLSIFLRVKSPLKFNFSALFFNGNMCCLKIHFIFTLYILEISESFYRLPFLVVEIFCRNVSTLFRFNYH